LTTIDGIWRDDSLVGGRRTLRATTRTLSLAGLANGLRLLQSARYALLASFQKAAATIWTIIAHVERGFADFAEIPYQDACTYGELSQLMDELEAEHHTDQFLPGVRLENPTADPEGFVCITVRLSRIHRGERFGRSLPRPHGTRATRAAAAPRSV
jgi:hypothetical protein